MNKRVILCFMLAPFIAKAEDGKLVNADGKKESAICIDAVKSNMNLRAMSKKYNMGKGKLKAINCNGVALADFVSMHRSEDKTNTPVKVFSFSNETNNVETELCIAAANSNARLKEVMVKHNKPKQFVENINCNGVLLKQFAKKYGNKSISI